MKTTATRSSVTIVGCPLCKNPLRIRAEYGIDFGARLWTDGKVEYPFRPIPPVFGFCKSCHGLIDEDDFIDAGVHPNDAHRFKADEHHNASAIELYEYLRGPRSNRSAGADDYLARRWFWHVCNDYTRREETSPIPHDYYRNNIFALIEGTYQTCECKGACYECESSVCEMYRNVGEFGKAMKLCCETKGLGPSEMSIVQQSLIEKKILTTQNVHNFRFGPGCLR